MEVVGFNPSNSVVFQLKHIMSNIESNLDIKKKELEKYNVGTLNYSKLEGEIKGLKFSLCELESALKYILIYILNDNNRTDKTSKASTQQYA